MTTLTANGTTEILWPREAGTLIASGTFGGGTLSIQVSSDNGTTKQTIDSLTADGVLDFSAATSKLYLTLSGATTPSIDYTVVPYEKGTSVSNAGVSTALANLLTELQLKADLTESQPILDDGPNEQPTVKNLVGVSLGSAQELVPALGAGLKGQIRDLIPSVDTDVKVSIYSGASTLFVGNLKAANGSIQLTPRQGFTGEANTAINMIATTASGTHDTTVNYVSVS